MRPDVGMIFPFSRIPKVDTRWRLKPIPLYTALRATSLAKPDRCESRGRRVRICSRLKSLIDRVLSANACLQKLSAKLRFCAMTSSVTLVITYLALAILSVQHNTAPSASNASFRDCSECPEMVVIPAGSFTIGSPATEKDRYVDEDPRRQVSIRRFAIGKFDVTRAQWAGFVTATKREIPPGCTWTGRTKMDVDPIGSWRNLGFEQDDTHPVVCVTWNDAQDYAHWLSQKTGKKYRLS